MLGPKRKPTRIGPVFESCAGLGVGDLCQRERTQLGQEGSQAGGRGAPSASASRSRSAAARAGLAPVVETVKTSGHDLQTAGNEKSPASLLA